MSAQHKGNAMTCKRCDERVVELKAEVNITTSDAQGVVMSEHMKAMTGHWPHCKSKGSERSGSQDPARPDTHWLCNTCGASILAEAS